MSKTKEQPPKLELKAAKLAKHLSEETPAYTAKVYVDGKHMVNVQNDGHGGCDRQDPAPGYTFKDVQLLNDRMKRTLDPVDVHGMSLEMNLELWCHTEVWRGDALKGFKRRMNTRIIFVDLQGEEKGVFEMKYQKATKQRTIDAIKKRWPGAEILNDTVPEAALDRHDEVIKQLQAARG
jgi:hypothetical protein